MHRPCRQCQDCCPEDDIRPEWQTNWRPDYFRSILSLHPIWHYLVLTVMPHQSRCDRLCHHLAMSLSFCLAMLCGCLAMLLSVWLCWFVTGRLSQVQLTRRFVCGILIPTTRVAECQLGLQICSALSRPSTASPLTQARTQRWWSTTSACCGQLSNHLVGGNDTTSSWCGNDRVSLLRPTIQSLGARAIQFSIGSSK